MTMFSKKAPLRPRFARLINTWNENDQQKAREWWLRGGRFFFSGDREGKKHTEHREPFPGNALAILWALERKRRAELFSVSFVEWSFVEYTNQGESLPGRITLPLGRQSTSPARCSFTIDVITKTLWVMLVFKLAFDCRVLLMLTSYKEELGN